MALMLCQTSLARHGSMAAPGGILFLSDLRRERTEREVTAVEAELGDISRGKDYPHLDPATGQWKGPAAPEMPADYRPSSSGPPRSTDREQRAAPWALDLPRMPEPTYNNQALDDDRRGRPRSRRDGRTASRRPSRNAAGRARLLADPSHHRQVPLPLIREVDERVPGHERSGERDSSPSAHGISRPKPTYDHKGKGKSTSSADLVTAQGSGVDAAAGSATLSFDTGRRLSQIFAAQTTGGSSSTGPWGKGQE
ncbi:hypothetical protein DL546_005175 [Coniochaeta pulveracea]|uniref:Uncharacterized protein n=1 Tax=Coniochaeta pulveracea TaxID=177199 RepID=A0A420Y7Y2_9PEZI|nr:hypothetical protein DL546_005175 [Coniochaeta pulveracea]